MPKAKRYRNQRLTKAPTPKRNRRKEDGRPTGTYKKYRFEETKLGFFLKYEVPVVYNIILNILPVSSFPEPPLQLIKVICSGSKDPSFKKKKYKRYLEDYAKYGLYCHRPVVMTPEKRKYYESIRRKKMERYIKQNRKRLDIV